MSRLFCVALLLSAAAVLPAQAAVIQLANNPAPGDSFTNPGATNQGQAIGSGGWYYNNTRNSGVVGINTTQPRSGNASVAFSSPTGSGKSDIEFLANGVNVGGNFFATGTLGTFANFSGMGYEWYRDGASTVAAVLHPSLRILLDRDGDLSTTGDRGGIVFEGAYNGAPSALTNQWVTEAIGSATNLWNFGLGLGFEFDIDGDGTPYDTLAEWQASALMANAVVLGFSSGVGSGWAGVFNGAVDNISWTFGTTTTSTNFEVAAPASVPEPASLALLGAGLAALGLSRRRNAR